MFSILSNFFQKKQIELYAALPLSACCVQRPYLLERAGIDTGSVILFAVPYLTPFALSPQKNISSYAVSKDYHLFFEQLFSELLPLLRAGFPQACFAGFADHSPIDEVAAAARAGLGVIGNNRMLITKAYSSYVFLGELITSLSLPHHMQEPQHCEGCGKCTAVCPAPGIGQCLSALSQKKGVLTQQKESALRQHSCAWGCDLCQEVCPHTRRAVACGSIYTPIPFFYEEPIEHLTQELIEQMSEADFSARAYAWRKKETLLRNLRLLQEQG